MQSYIINNGVRPHSKPRKGLAGERDYKVYINGNLNQSID